MWASLPTRRDNLDQSENENPDSNGGGGILRGYQARSNSESVFCRLILNLYLWRFPGVWFTWYVVLCSTASFIVGYCAISMMPRTYLNMQV